MASRSKTGQIEVVAGVMFSGKSEELIRRVRRAVIAGRKVQVFKSHFDDQYRGLHSVSTHDGIAVEAQPVDSASDIMRLARDDSDVVAVDEVQFLDEGIVSVCTTLANEGVRVILAGTDTDFRGEPFGCMPARRAVSMSTIESPRRRNCWTGISNWRAIDLAAVGSGFRGSPSRCPTTISNLACGR